MSTDIEQRVVEMRFDNAQFEKNIQTSMKSLENLDKTLDTLDSGKSLESLNRAANKIDMSNLSKQADNVRVSFSAMQVFAVNALNDIYNVAKRIGSAMLSPVTSAFNQIKTGGWGRATNIDQAKFQLEGLKVSWKDIYNDIDYAVSGTAYGLDAAAKAASQLVASGVQFGDTFGETGNSPMAKALRGISGLAAMTNSSYEEMSRIVTAVAGQGKLMTMQLRQLELRGLNIASTMAKSMNTTEQAVRDMVTRGEIDFKEFSEAMDEAFGEHAKDANKTFEGALDNMKAALSRIGQLFATPIRAEAIPIFNELRLLFNTIKKATEPIAEDFERIAHAFSGFVAGIIKGQNNVSTISNIMYGFRNILRTVAIVAIYVKRAFEEVFPPLKDVSYEFYKFTNRLVPTEKAMEGFKTVLKTLLTPLKFVFDILKAGLRILGAVATVVVEVIKHFNEYLSVFGIALDPFISFIRNTDFLGIAFNAVAVTAAAAIAGVRGFVTLIENLISKVGKSEPFQKFVNAMKDFAKTVGALAYGAFSSVVKLFDYLFHPSSKKSETVEQVKEFSKHAGGLVKAVSDDSPLVRFANGLRNIAKTIVGLAGGALATVVGLFEKLFGSNKKYDGMNLIQKTLLNMVDILERVFSVVGKVAFVVGTTLYGALKTVYGVVKWLVTGLASLFSVLGKNFKDVVHAEDVGEALTAVLNGLKNTVLWFFDNLGPLGKRIKEVLSNINTGKLLLIAFSIVTLDILRRFASLISAFGGILNAITSIPKTFSTLTGTIKGMFKMADRRNMILGLSLAIATFTAALAGLGHLMETKEGRRGIRDAAEVLGWFSAAAVGAMVAVGVLAQFGDEAKLKATAEAITSLGFAIASFAIAIYAVSNMRIRDLQSYIAGIIAMIGFLITASASIVWISKRADNLRASIFGMIAFAISLKILCDAFIGVLKMGFDPQEAVIFLLGVMAIVAVVSLLMGRINKMDTASSVLKLSKFGIHIHTLTIGIGVILLGLAAVAKMINDFNNSEKATFDDGLIAIAETMGAIAGFIFVIGGFATLFQKGFGSIGNALKGIAAMALGISVAIGILALVVDNVTSSEMDQINKFLIEIGVFIAGVIVSLGLLGDAKIEGVGRVFLGISSVFFSLALFIGAMAVISMFLTTGKGFGVGMLLAVVLGMITAIVAIVSGLGKLNMAKTVNQATITGSLIAVAVIIGLIGAIIGLLTLTVSAFGIGYAIGMVVMVGGLLYMLIWMLNTVAKVQNVNKNATDILRQLVALVGIIAILIGGLATLTMFTPNGVWDVIAVIGGVTLIIAVIIEFFKAVNKAGTLNPSESAKAFIGEMSAFIFIIGLAMGIVTLVAGLSQGEGWKNILSSAVAIAGIMFAMAGVLKIISNIKIDPQTIAALGELGVIFAILFGVFAIISAISIFTEPGQMIENALAIGAIMMAFSLAMILLGEVPKIDSSVIGAFLLMSVAIGILAGIVALVSLLDMDNVIKAALSVGILGAALAAMLLLMSSISSNAGTLLAAGGAFILMSIGIVAVAAALALLLSVVNEDNWWVFLIATVGIVALVAAIGGFAAGLALVNDICGVVVPVMAALAADILSVALTVRVAALAVSLIIEEIMKLINLLAELSSRSDVDTARMKEMLDIIGYLALQLTKVGSSVALLALALLGVGVGALAAAFGITVVAFALLLFAAAAAAAAIGVGLLALALAALVLVLVAPFIILIKFFPKIGEYLMQGLADGILRGANGVIDSMLQVCSSFAKSVEEFFGISSPSKLFRWIGDMIMTGFIHGIIEKFPALADVLEPIAQSCYELADEIEAAGDTWSDAAAVGAEHAMDAIQNVLDSIGLDFGNITGQFAGIFGTGMSATDIIDDYRIPDSTAAHANAKERWIVEGYESAAAWEEAHKDDSWFSSLIPDFDEIMPDFDDALPGATAGLGEFGDAAGGAANKVDELTKSIQSALDVFTEFNATTDMTANQVLRNFMSQLTGVNRWAVELEALASRDIHPAFLAELSQMGPDAYEKIHAMYEMSDQQLSLFNKMYAEKLSIEASTAADIQRSFATAGTGINDALSDVGSDVGNTIADNTKAGTEEAIKYVEKFVDDGQKATDMIDVGYDERGFKLNDRARWEAEGYESAEAWEEAHKKACTKMVPVINQAYNEVAESASDNVQNTVASSINEMEQGVKDSYKIGAEIEYVGGVIIPKGITDGIESSKPSVIKAFASLAYESMEAFEEYLKIEDSIKAVEAFRDSVAATVTSSIKLFDKVEESEEISAEEMLQRMKENVKNVGKWANDLQSLAARGISDGLLSELQALGPEGADKVHAFTKMTDAQLAQANQAFAASATLPKYTADRITKSYAEAGMQTTLGFVEGIDPEAADEVMTALATSSLDALKEALDIHSPSRKTYEAGMYSVAGLVLGIEENLPLIKDAGAQMGLALTDSLASDPAVLAESVALFFTTLGKVMLNGIMEFKASEAMSFFRETVADMINHSVDDMVIEPTIKPVIDDSNIRANRSLFSNLVNGFNITPTIGRASDASVASKKDYSNDLRDISNLLRQTRDEVGLIRRDVVTLQDAMSGMNVTLDGATVGKVMTPYVNANLGNTYVRDKRRKL